MPPQLPQDLTARLDQLLMHRWIGLPLFLFIMFMLFQGVFTLGTPLQESLAGLIQTADGWLRETSLIQALPGLGQSLGRWSAPPATPPAPSGHCRADRHPGGERRIGRGRWSPT